MTITVRRSEVERYRRKIFLVLNPKTHRVIGLRVFRTIILWGKGSR